MLGRCVAEIWWARWRNWSDRRSVARAIFAVTLRAAGGINACAKARALRPGSPARIAALEIRCTDLRPRRQDPAAERSRHAGIAVPATPFHRAKLRRSGCIRARRDSPGRGCSPAAPGPSPSRGLHGKPRNRGHKSRRPLFEIVRWAQLRIIAFAASHRGIGIQSGRTPNANRRSSSEQLHAARACASPSGPASVTIAAQGFKISQQIPAFLVGTIRRAVEEPGKGGHDRIRDHGARRIEMRELPVRGADGRFARKVGSDAARAPELRIIEDRLPG